MLILTFLTLASALFSQDVPEAMGKIETHYLRCAQTPSDINEHLPVLKMLATKCSSVTEIGLRSMVSSWAILEGLVESQAPIRSYLGIDIAEPPAEILQEAKELSKICGISFQFLCADDRTVQIEPCEMLFIDSLHTYAHLTYELEIFSPKVSRYIALHDTSAPWGHKEDTSYTGDYSEYPAWIPNGKKGLWPAVEDFLANHPEWSLLERRLNNHGFTILERVH